MGQVRRLLHPSQIVFFVAGTNETFCQTYIIDHSSKYTDRYPRGLTVCRFLKPLPKTPGKGCLSCSKQRVDRNVPSLGPASEFFVEFAPG